MPRFYCPLPLAAGAQFDLPAGAARHVQVLRLQPGDAITLFNGAAAHGQWQAQIVEMGRSHVQVRLVAHEALECEHRRPVHLLAGITANERMDWLVEKATELGAASLTPLLAERSVLELKGERGEKKRDHWQAVAVAACEQCGRNQVPVHSPSGHAGAVAGRPPANIERKPRRALAGPGQPPVAASGASGSGAGGAALWPRRRFKPARRSRRLGRGFAPITLGPRVLRAETAPLAALALLDQG